MKCTRYLMPTSLMPTSLMPTNLKQTLAITALALLAPFFTSPLLAQKTVAQKTVAKSMQSGQRIQASPNPLIRSNPKLLALQSLNLQSAQPAFSFCDYISPGRVQLSHVPGQASTSFELKSKSCISTWKVETRSFDADGNLLTNHSTLVPAGVCRIDHSTPNTAVDLDYRVTYTTLSGVVQVQGWYSLSINDGINSWWCNFWENLELTVDTSIPQVFFDFNFTESGCYPTKWWLEIQAFGPQCDGALQTISFSGTSYGGAGPNLPAGTTRIKYRLRAEEGYDEVVSYPSPTTWMEIRF